MIRYNEMTPEQLVALNDEQINLLVEIEIAFASIKPVEPPKEVTLDEEGIKPCVTAYKVGDLIFLDRKDAEAVAAMPLMRQDYNYQASYAYKWLSPAEHSVEKAVFYKQEDVNRAARVINYNEKRKNVFNEQKRQYEAYLSETNKIRDTVWSAIMDAKDAVAKIECGRRAYRKYLGLAEGDEFIALKFFRDAFKDDEKLADAVLKLELPQPVPAVAVDTAVSGLPV
jgi:hypothetical protein